MSRTLLAAGLSLLLSLPVCAQMGARGAGGRGGYGGPGAGGIGGRVGHAGGAARAPGIYSFPAPNTYGSPHGYGNVVFPGTGHAPGTYSPFSIVDPTFGARLAQTVTGYRFPFTHGFGFGYGGFRKPFGAGTVIIPYAYPVYIPYPEPQVQVAPPPQIIYVVPGEPDRSVTTTAPVPRRESVVTYVAPSAGETRPRGESQSKFYLIALKNYSIYTATEYWLEGDTLHYRTPYGAHNQVSLDQVDLELTERLNRERGLEFRLER